MSALLRPAIVLFLLFTALTGVAYPLLVTGFAKAFFPRQAGGSIIKQGERAVGSSLIGQEFTSPGHFWSRASATAPVPYTAFNAKTLTGSSGSNLGPTNPTLISNVQARIDALRAADAAVGYARPAEERVPVDLVTSSGSGLDPHISKAAALYQLPRVARARGIATERVAALVTQFTQERVLGLLGEPTVNVLELNLALDAEQSP